MIRIRARSRAGAVTSVLALALGLGAGACANGGGSVSVVVHMPGPSQTLKSAKLVVDYARSGAAPLRKGGAPCTVLLPTIEASFSDDGRGRLTIDVGSARGFSPPVDLVACRMTTERRSITAAEVESLLDIKVTSALDADGEELSDRRLASVSSRMRSRHTDRSVAHATPREPGTRSAERSPGAAPRDGSAAIQRRGEGRSAATTAPSPSPRSDDPSRAERPQTPRSDGGRGALVLGNPRSGGSPSAAGGGPGGGSGNAGSGPDAGGSGPVGRTEPWSSLPTHDYEVTISILNNVEDLGALQIDVEFLGSSGAFVGRGGDVDCTSMVAGSMSAFNREDQALKAGFISMDGIPTPAPVAICIFKSRETVTSSSFGIQVTDASNSESKKVEPLPFVAVSDVRLIR